MVFNWHVNNSSIINKNKLLAVIYYLNNFKEGGETLFRIDSIIKSIKTKKGKYTYF